MAVAVHPEMTYCLMRHQDGKLVVVSVDRFEQLANDRVLEHDLELLGKISGKSNL